MNLLNFSWVIDGKLAGHQAPSSERDLEWLKEQGVLALVRMAEELKAKVSSPQAEQRGLLDCHEPVPDFTAPSLGLPHEKESMYNVSLKGQKRGG